MKYKYVATAPDGTRFTRSSERKYTHAVIVWAKSWRDHQWKWLIHGFSGSRALAEKAAALCRKHRTDPGERVEIVEAQST